MRKGKIAALILIKVAILGKDKKIVNPNSLSHLTGFSQGTKELNEAIHRWNEGALIHWKEHKQD